MTQEEKAKAYDEALERARKMLNMILDEELLGFPDQIREIFPQLKESEDEKMINELQGFLDSFGADYFGTGEWQKFHDWLEKQKESLHISETCKENPNSFTNEDERIRKFLVDYAIEMIAGLGSDISLSTYDGIKGHDPEAEAELAQWQKARAYLEKQKEPENVSASTMIPFCWEVKQKEQKPEESISQLTVQGKGVYKICPRCKERMVRDDSMVYTSMPPQYRYECPKCGESECDTVMYDNPEMEEQKPVEWSDEDEDMLNSCISSIEEAKENRYAYKETDGDTSYDHEIAWLKSIRPSKK